MAFEANSFENYSCKRAGHDTDRIEKWAVPAVWTLLLLDLFETPQWWGISNMCFFCWSTCILLCLNLSGPVATSSILASQRTHQLRCNSHILESVGGAPAMLFWSCSWSLIRSSLGCRSLQSCRQQPIHHERLSVAARRHGCAEPRMPVFLLHLQ